MRMIEVQARANARKYRIQAEYLGGDTMQQIADRWGITRQRVHSMLNSIGTPTRPRGPRAAHRNGDIK